MIDRRNLWAVPCVYGLAVLNWLVITLPAKRWAKKRPESQT